MGWKTILEFSKFADAYTITIALGPHGSYLFLLIL